MSSVPALTKWRADRRLEKSNVRNSASYLSSKPKNCGVLKKLHATTPGNDWRNGAVHFSRYSPPFVGCLRRPGIHRKRKWPAIAMS